jgi:hypothetical protein
VYVRFVILYKLCAFVGVCVCVCVCVCMITVTVHGMHNIKFILLTLNVPKQTLSGKHVLLNIMLNKNDKIYNDSSNNNNNNSEWIQRISFIFPSEI